MPKNIQILRLKVIIRESIVTGHLQMFIPEISQNFYIVKLSPRESFFP